jgi:hypothetical protein
VGNCRIVTGGPDVRVPGMLFVADENYMVGRYFEECQQHLLVGCLERLLVLCFLALSGARKGHG